MYHIYVLAKTVKNRDRVKEELEHLAGQPCPVPAIATDEKDEPVGLVWKSSLDKRFYSILYDE